MAMTLVSTTTVPSGGAASIEFTNIPQTGKDLLVLCSLRNSNNSQFAIVSVNGLAGGVGANYPARDLIGNGSTVSSVSNNNSYISGGANNSTYTASTFSNMSVYVSNYANAVDQSFSIDAVNENNSTTAFQSIVAMSANTDAAVTSFKLQPGSGNFDQYSSASLYLIS